ncbi:MAG: YceI family protein, partial [Actinomycetes bacterium]
DWGLTWNVALETGGVLVSKKVKLEIEAQAVLQQA